MNFLPSFKLGKHLGPYFNLRLIYFLISSTFYNIGVRLI